MPKPRVFVAMSGGVDSSVAAALLQQEGTEVIGVTLQIWPPDEDTGQAHGCCGQEAIASAQRVAHKLGIRHYVLNFREVFARTVIADFCREYGRGRTPNPCLVCNQDIKFGTLLDRVLTMGADYLATGHYARIETAGGSYRLLKGTDRAKDQSYFLYPLRQRELRHLLFPVGGLTKTAVRKQAAAFGLPTATRRESQDICFIPDNNYRAFVARYLPATPGDITDTAGRVLGRHHGLAAYTVGQRQGLGVAASGRRYVLRLDTADNRRVIGTRELLLTDTVVASKLSWVSGEAPEDTA
ncbi:MAG: tRNA 2-thiouridine(34) synthase MnmA, partial [Chloroflexota bacterium]